MGIFVGSGLAITLHFLLHFSSICARTLLDLCVRFSSRTAGLRTKYFRLVAIWIFLFFVFFCVRTLAMLFISRQRNGNYLARVIMDLLVLLYALQYFVAHYFSVLLVFHPIVVSQWQE